MKTSEVWARALHLIETRDQQYICFALEESLGFTEAESQRLRELQAEVCRTIEDEATVQTYLTRHFLSHLPFGSDNRVEFTRSVRIFWLNMLIAAAQAKGD